MRTSSGLSSKRCRHALMLDTEPSAAHSRKPRVSSAGRLDIPIYIADHEQTSALRRDLDQLSSDAGAKLLRALGVKGDEAELRSASDEFRGHCLALTLLGSYLTDAFDGDVRRREEVSARLAHDLRQGAHAQKVMESYQTWFGEVLSWQSSGC